VNTDDDRHDERVIVPLRKTVPVARSDRRNRPYVGRSDHPSGNGTGPSSVTTFVRYLQLTVTDTLAVWADGSHAVNPSAKVVRTAWYRLPDHWVIDDVLAPGRCDRLVDNLYGPDWRRGHPDGSRFVLLDLRVRVLSPEEARTRPWLGDRAAFYAWDTDDDIHEVIPARL
jgi:hypothetical protein